MSDNSFFINNVLVLSPEVASEVCPNAMQLGEDSGADPLENPSEVL